MRGRLSAGQQQNVVICCIRYGHRYFRGRPPFLLRIADDLMECGLNVSPAIEQALIMGSVIAN